MSDITPREIRAKLQERLPELLARLFPRHTITYPVFTPLNPTRADNNPGSFVIWTGGNAAGGFNEYAPGFIESGDVIDLISYVQRHGKDRRFALAYARDFLGIKAMGAAERARFKREANVAAAKVAAQASEQIARRVTSAVRLWARTVPIAGSVGETYFASRRIPLMLIPHREPDTLRFMPSLEHWKSAVWKDKQKVAPGPSFPAVVAAIRNRAGELRGVHCTFIRADGSGKADVGTPKLMLGDVKGHFIAITRGPDNLELKEAEGAGVIEPFAIAEGIENSLSVAMHVPEARHVAAGSFDLMLAVDVMAMAFEPIVYVRDNDDNARADEAIEDHIAGLIEAGKPASWMAASGVKDFNKLVGG